MPLYSNVTPTSIQFFHLLNYNIVLIPYITIRGHFVNLCQRLLKCTDVFAPCFYFHPVLLTSSLLSFLLAFTLRYWRILESGLKVEHFALRRTIDYLSCGEDLSNISVIYYHKLF